MGVITVSLTLVCVVLQRVYKTTISFCICLLLSHFVAFMSKIFTKTVDNVGFRVYHIRSNANKEVRFMEGFKRTLIVAGASFAYCLILYLLMKWQGGVSDGTKLILLLCIPLGFILFLMGDGGVAWQIVRGVGLVLIVIPVFIVHVPFLSMNMKLKDLVNPKTLHFAEISLFPMVCLSAVTAYWEMGFDGLAGLDAFAQIGVVYWPSLLSFVTWFVGVLCQATIAGLAWFYLVVGVVALAIIGIMRLKFGTAFEYVE